MLQITIIILLQFVLYARFQNDVGRYNVFLLFEKVQYIRMHWHQTPKKVYYT